MNSRAERSSSVAPLDALRLALTVLIVTLAVSPGLLIFPSESPSRVALIGVAISTVIALQVLMAFMRLRPRVSVICSVGLPLVIAGVTTLSTEGTEALPQLLSSFVAGVPRLLTTRLPLGTVADTLGALSIVIWAIAASVGVAVIGRSPLSVVLGTVIAGHTAVLAMVAGGLDGTEVAAGTTAATIVVAVLILAAVDAVTTSGDLARRSIATRAGAGALVILVIVAGVLGADIRPPVRSETASLRFDPTPLLQPGPDPVPLVQALRLGAPGQPSDESIVRVRIEEAPARGWHGYLALSRFDGDDYVGGGQRWRSATAFVPTGGVDPLREVNLLGGEDRTLVLEITLEDDTLGGWVPHPRPLNRIERLATATNGQGLIAAEPGACDEGCTYISRGIAASFSTDVSPISGAGGRDSDLADRIGDRLSGRPYPGPTAAGQEAHPARQVCEALRPRLRINGIDCDEPVDVAMLLTAGQRVIGSVGRVGGTDRDTQPIASSERLADILTLLRTNDESTASDPIQFATAFALLLQHFQIDAEVAVGLRAADCSTAEGGVRGLTGLCTGGAHVTLGAGDAWAWVELRLDGIGWLVLDPSPAEGAIEQRETEALAGEDSRPPATRSGEAASLLVTEAEANEGPVGPRPALPLLRWSGAVGLFAATLLVPGAAVRLIRRRRRASGTPEDRAAASLHELVEALHDAGERDLLQLTAHEVVALIVERVEAKEAAGQVGSRDRTQRGNTTIMGASRSSSTVPGPLEPVRRAADTVVFSARGITAAESDQAWEVSRDWSKRVRRSSGVAQRLLAAIAPPPSRLTRGPREP